MTKPQPTLRDIIFWIYYIPIGLPLFVLETAIISALIVLGCALGYGSWASRHLGWLWSRITLALHFCPVTIVGREHLPTDKQSYIVVANHQSAFDIYALYGYIDLPFKWVLKEELRRMPFVGWACSAAGFIFVDDTKRSSIHQTLTDAKKTLGSGQSIFIFPEGSRTMTGEMIRFKKGAFVIASELGVPILPVSIDGAFDILRRGDRIARPNRITLTIHKPIQPQEYGESPRSIMLLASDTQRIIATALSREDQTKWA